VAGGEPLVAGDTARILQLRTPYLRDSNVETLQQALAVVAHFQINVDGVYGPYTDALVGM
jgi:peptidoglycan hydrolase-like protein with peptidoglycan-binding domain